MAAAPTYADAAFAAAMGFAIAAIIWAYGTWGRK
jgi:hypothetical protein